MDENYERLAEAIVMRAVMDLRGAFRRLRRFPDDTMSQDEVRSITGFFCSQYFNILTSLDGPSLLRKIIDEMEERA